MKIMIIFQYRSTIMVQRFVVLSCKWYDGAKINTPSKYMFTHLQKYKFFMKNLNLYDSGFLSVTIFYKKWHIVQG